MFTVPPKYHKTSIFYVVILNIIVLGATLTLFFTTRNNETLAIQNNFKQESTLFINNLEKELASRNLVLENFQNYLNGSDTVSQDSFQAYTDRQNPAEFNDWSIAWVPNAALVSTTENLPPASRWDPATRVWAVSDSAAKYPITFLNSKDASLAIEGYDLSSQSQILQAMVQANDTKSTIALQNATPFSEQENAAEMLLVQPIWAPGKPGQDATGDTDRLVGFALGIVRIDQLLTSGIKAQDLRDISIEMNNSQSILNNDPQFTTNEQLENSILSIPLFSDQFQFGSNEWLIKVIPNNNYLQIRRGMLPWAFLLGGILVSLLLNALTWFMVFETYAVREQVIERTEALNSTNQLLWDSTNELNKTKTLLKAKIVEKEQVEESLARANQQLTESPAQAKQSNLLESMTREIRAPMHGMIGITDLLNDTPLDHQQMGLVQTIKSSGETLLSTINNIVDFSRIESGEMPIVLAPFDLRRRVEESIEAVAFNSYEKDIELILNIESSVPDWIESDERRIQQIINSLLINAVNFTENGEITVSISGREIDHQQMLQISVKDTGIGIPADYLKTLFDPAENEGENESIRDRFLTSGLSLSICKRLAELLGGTITVESVENQGSTFTLLILANNAEELNNDPLELELNNLKGKRGLVIFPNHANRQLVSTMLEDWEVACDCTSSPTEALKLFKLTPEKYDFIVFDAKLGEMDCGYFTLELKQVTPHIPLLIAYTTLNSLQAQMFETIEEIELWLYKPIKQKPLYNAISDYFLQQEHAPAENHRKLKAYNKKFAQDYPLQILIAEDNRINQKVAATTLARLGYQVDFASNGLEALERVVHKRYDLVFIDIHMPRMSGVQAIKGIKRSVNRKLEKKPIVIGMTNQIRQEEKERCVEAGANGFILKPFKVDHLVRVLKDVHSHRAKRFEKQMTTSKPVVELASTVEA